MTEEKARRPRTWNLLAEARQADEAVVYVPGEGYRKIELPPMQACRKPHGKEEE